VNDMATMASPILKWAGGKRQLIHVIDTQLPSTLKNGEIENYWEPMIGGGAVFFHIKNKYGSKIENYYISDYNWDLFVLYRVVQSHVEQLIDELQHLSDQYLPLPPIKKGQKTGKRITMFKRLREEYNHPKWAELRYRKDGRSPRKRFHKDWIRRACLTIFLNRTCFNGLYRVNANGEFNVPHGRYDKPDIVNANNLRAVKKVLEDVKINVGTYSNFITLMDSKSFVYFDPPYRPLPNTNSFKDYHKAQFGDKEQLELADLCRELDRRGVQFLLSNSDPKNTDETDDFFDEAYSGFQLIRTGANRNINSDGEKRGKISEILVRNYSVKGRTQQTLSSDS